MAQAPPTAIPTAVQLLEAAGATLDGAVWTVTMAQLDTLYALALPHNKRLMAGRINSNDLAYTLVWSSAASMAVLNDSGAGYLLSHSSCPFVRVPFGARSCSPRALTAPPLRAGAPTALRTMDMSAVITALARRSKASAALFLAPTQVRASRMKPRVSSATAVDSPKTPFRTSGCGGFWAGRNCGSAHREPGPRKPNPHPNPDPAPRP